jgi:ligand-binding sensor domain-containing protein
MRKVLPLLLTLVSVSFLLYGQAPHFQKYFLLKKNDPVHVNAMLQNKAGFIWYATNKGLFSFDGINLKRFTIKDSLPDENVTALAEDSLGRIWMGCKNGKISYFDNDKIIAFTPEEGNSPHEISDILFDHRGNLWFSTLDDGVYYYTNRLYRLDETDGIPDLFIYDLTEDSHGNIWAATDGGVAVCTLNNGKVTVKTIDQSNGLPDNIVKKIYINGNESVFLATEDKGIVWYNPVTNTFSPFINKTWSQGSITDFTVVGNAIWLAVSQTGLIVYNRESQTSKIYAAKTEGTLTLINKLLLDFEGNVWAGTKTGVLRTYADHVELVSDFEITKNVNVLAVAVDKQNNLWFSNGEGLYKQTIYKNNTQQVTQQLINTSLKSKTIISLYCDAEGFMWAGLYGEGVIRIDPSTGKVVHFNSELRNGNILSITGKGNVVWLATLGGGTRIEIQPGKFAIRNYGQNEGLISDYIYQIFIDGNDRVWFATDGKGVDMLDRTGLHHIAGPIKNKVVFGFAEDKSATIWANVQGEGLYKFDGHEFKPFGAIKLRDSNINTFGIDKVGNIVVFHDLGMDVIDVTTNHVNYIADEGIHTKMANLNAVAKDTQWRLYFGTDGGVVSYLPSADTHMALPRPFIDGLKILNNDMVVRPGQFLDHDQNSITINYHGFWFQNPQGLDFRYKLVNYDQDWIASHDRSATYSSLPPGKYTFTLQTSTTSDFGKASETTFEFSIEPPFWKTKLFYVIVVVIMASGLYAYVTYRERALIKAQHILEEKVEERTQEIQKKNEEIQAQAEEIRGINENLEMLVQQRTVELEKKNKALEESAFIIAHELRAPVASVLGLINLMSRAKLDDEGKAIIKHMDDSAEKLNAIVRSITKAIERADDANTPKRDS